MNDEITISIAKCCKCDRELNQASPSQKSLDRLERNTGVKINGRICSKCLSLLDTSKKRSNAKRPLREANVAAHLAIAADDYASFADARLEIESGFDEVEEKIRKTLRKLRILSEVRNSIFNIRSAIEEALSKSPRASYFARRLKSNQVIATHQVRSAVFHKSKFKCAHCGTRENLSVDHIIPVLHGGGDELENLQALCRRCNSSKGGRIAA
jgi:5-methylcytosine-specific restriction endonuclease McrA